MSQTASRRALPLAAAIAAVALTAAVVLATRGGPGGPAGGEPPPTARHVIFFLGDGMGAAARDLVRLMAPGRDGRLAMDRLRYAGLVETAPADPAAHVTDSAAAATAFATGVRTRNGAVGVDSAGRRRPTLLERARAAGRSTGLVTTAQVTDASPAAFAAHVPHRSDHAEIARQYLEESRPDVILGGGEDHWRPAGAAGGHSGRRGERGSSMPGDLLARARDLGYTHVSTRAQLRRAPRRSRLLGLFADEALFRAAPEGGGGRYDPAVPLHEMTAAALEVLGRDPDGFFLLVEEEAIDEFAHHGNTRRTAQAGAALDRAVAVGMRFATAHPGTLVVVAADHETGGLAIEEPGERAAQDGPFDPPGPAPAFGVDWTTTEHTGASTPLTAQGPGAAALARVQDGTDVHDVLLRAMRLDRG